MTAKATSSTTVAAPLTVGAAQAQDFGKPKTKRTGPAITKQPRETMTPEQFLALAKLMRLQKRTSASAAYLHFVHGMRIVDAAKKVQCTTRATTNCVARVKAALQLAEKAVK
jgi:hypothetical protein